MYPCCACKCCLLHVKPRQQTFKSQCAQRLHANQKQEFLCFIGYWNIKNRCLKTALQICLQPILFLPCVSKLITSMFQLFQWKYATPAKLFLKHVKGGESLFDFTALTPCNKILFLCMYTADAVMDHLPFVACIKEDLKLFFTRKEVINLCS